MTLEQLKATLNQSNDELQVKLRAEVHPHFDKLYDEQKKIKDDLVDLTKRVHGESFSRTGSDGGNVGLIAAAIEKDAGFKALRQTGRGRCVITTPSLLGQKALTSTGITTVVHEREVSDSGRQAFGRVRRLMPSMPISTASAFFVREISTSNPSSSTLWQASPQTEGLDKIESTVTFEGLTAPVRTIATWAGASKQILDDMQEMEQFLSSSLIWAVEKEFEGQLLFGSGVGEDLTGLAVTATAFDQNLLTLANPANAADRLLLAALQLQEAGHACTGFVVSPRAWVKIQLLKTATEEAYLVGDPRRDLREILWSTPIVPSPAMGADDFLAGDFATGAHIRLRQDSTIDISDSHGDYFVKNLLAIRAEMRAALVVKKPGAFIYGTFA